MSPRAFALILPLAACAPAEERSWARFTPAEAQAWALAAPHACSGPEPTPFGAVFEPDGVFRDLPGGPPAGAWSVTPAGAVCVRREGERNPACWGLARSNYGVAAFLVTPLDRALSAAEAPLRAARPDGGRAHCTRA